MPLNDRLVLNLEHVYGYKAVQMRASVSEVANWTDLFRGIRTLKSGIKLQASNFIIVTKM